MKDKLSSKDYATLEKDLAGIRARPSGPEAIQYALVADSSGPYLCYLCSSGAMNLAVGDVWKYGQTKNELIRYSQNELNGTLAGARLRLIEEFRGTQRQVLINLNSG
ncbi:hypothetical protein [Rheinheimera soli]|uniref:Uncharacterized protein n=1 Tax=Rheinheimera soli TaxID=443616 RepID=A0ABU1W5E4_9GAMM|nr:hypothetical protein [Rheinheimera soli]MDR7123174.1 hypothetical protein [Rheinheimera soli]